MTHELEQSQLEDVVNFQLPGTGELCNYCVYKGDELASCTRVGLAESISPITLRPQVVIELAVLIRAPGGYESCNKFDPRNTK